MTDTKNNEEVKSNKTSRDLDVELNKTVAALSYIWILCLVPLLAKKDSEYAQFHAKQGLVLFIVEIVGSLFFWFPFFGQLLAMVLLIVSVIGVIKTLNGEWWEAPVIFEWSKKIKL